jgi:hypothetical protein
MSDTTFAEQPTDELPDLTGLSDAELLAQLHTAPAQVETPTTAAPAPAPAPAEPAAEVTPQAPGEGAPAAAEPVAEPAPAIDPASQRDPNKANNFRIQAQNAVEQQALELRKQDSTLSLAEALNQSYQMLGLPSPFQTAAPAAEAAKPAQEAPPAEELENPLTKIQAEIADLTEQKKGLNKVIDADEVEALNDRLAELREERVRVESRQFFQEQQAEMQTAQILNDLERQVQAEFPDLANPQHPLTLAYEAELKQLCATAPDHVLQDPQMEIKLAARIAQRFETEFQMPVKRASKPAATAPVAKTNTTVTQPAAPPAVAAPPAAVRPSSAAAPVVSTSASASPVMGIAPQNPLAAFEALLASGQPLGEEADALLLAARFDTAPAPAGTRFRAA